MKIFYRIISIIPLLVVGWWFFSGYLGDGTEDTPEWKIRNLIIWKNTPAWDLALAVKRQDTTRIKRIATAHPQWLDYQESRYGATLLIWAVGVEKYRSVEALLKCGANPDLTNKDGETALYVASSYSWVDYQAKEDPKYVKLLLKYKADPNIHNTSNNEIDRGYNPLMESIPCGIEKTKALVEGGADINYKTATGETAALLALWAGGPNATEAGMEYAYYLIAVKKAKVTDPYIRTVTEPDGSKNILNNALVTYLRDWIPHLNSQGYRMKMKIVNEFSQQGVDYWKIAIPDERLQQIKHIYPDTWQEYIKKY